MKHQIINVETGKIETRDYSESEIAELTEQAWNRLRNDRNSLLAASDWTVLGDSPTPTAAWKVYRQALRDLPASTSDPLNVVWPTPPS